MIDAYATAASYPFLIGWDGLLYDRTGKRIYTELPYRLTTAGIIIDRLRRQQRGM